MNIGVIGINHKKSPIEIRERFYLHLAERELLLSELKSEPSVIGAFVVSTCNRTEIYVHMTECNLDRITEVLFKVKKIPLDPALQQHFYTYAGKEVIEHIMNVACGLDSLVLGEKQILGQVRSSLELARDKGMLSKQFNLLAQATIRAGKQAQNNTEISYGGSSVSWAAVAMAQKVCTTLKDKVILVIGAGKMGDSALSQLKAKGVKKIYIMNRTHEKAVAFARKYDGEAVHFWQIESILKDIDVCFCSVGAPHYLIEADLVEKSLGESGRPCLFVDISTPRNIHPDVAQLGNVSLLTIDDLKNVVEENANRRQEAVKAVQAIVASKMALFDDKLSRLSHYDEMNSADDRLHV